MNESSLVVIADATKRFAAPEGGVITALDAISFNVNDKEFVTLLGPSGCGKTTLLRAISGFEDLDSGTIVIDNQLMTHVPPHRRPVNTVFQNYALFPHLSVGDNIGYGLDVTGCAKPERNQRVDEVLELVGLVGFERRRPKQLSGGQQQRVALARAIINRPKLLLLDEPLSALDRKLRQAMQLELKNIQHELGIAFVFVTHDQEEALTMSDRIVVLDRGGIQQIGTPTTIYDSPVSIFVAQFVGEGNLFSGTFTRDGDVGTLRTDSGINIVIHDLLPGINNGDKAAVLIRPEDLELLDSPNETKSGAAVLEVRIAQTVFVGTDFQIVGSTTTGETLKATIRDPSRTLASRLGEGDVVRFTYRPHAPRLLPMSENANDPSPDDA